MSTTAYIWLRRPPRKITHQRGKLSIYFHPPARPPAPRTRAPATAFRHHECLRLVLAPPQLSPAPAPDRRAHWLHQGDAAPLVRPRHHGVEHRCDMAAHRGAGRRAPRHSGRSRCGKADTGVEAKRERPHRVTLLHPASSARGVCPATSTTGEPALPAAPSLVGTALPPPFDESRRHLLHCRPGPCTTPSTR